MYVRGRISTGMESLLHCMPKYENDDFLLMHRKNDKGHWKTELRTARDFQPLEIMLAPLSSQLKETHLMQAAHAVVTLPKHGPGAHPQNSSLCLDGRLRNHVAPAGFLDQEEHRGNLYWIVSRTTNKEKANLDMDEATWQQHIKVTLPAPAKKRKIHNLDWEANDLPSFAIMVNKSTIKKNTQLLVFLPEKPKTTEKTKTTENGLEVFVDGHVRKYKAAA